MPRPVDPNDPDIIVRASNAVKIGLTRELAAKYVGISDTTWYKWVRLGAQGHEKYVAFSEAVNAAEGEGAMRLMKRIEKAAKDGHWQAAAWIMERRHGYRKDGHLQIEHSGQVQINAVAQIPDDQLNAEIAKLEAEEQDLLTVEFRLLEGGND